VESPFSRTDTKQSEAETGSYPPVEGFLSLASGHTEGMAKAEPAASAAGFLPKERSLATSGVSAPRPCSERAMSPAEFAAFVDDLRFVASLV
jgi:hypothetical protein